MPMGAPGAPMYPILAKGDDPSNLDGCRAYLRNIVGTKAGYLFHKQFNNVTSLIPDAPECDWEKFLAHQSRSSEVKSEVQAVSGTSDGVDEDLLETTGGFGTPSKAPWGASHPTSWEDQSPIPAPSELRDPRYMDPMTRTVESPEKHALRYYLWGIVELMFVHHKHLLTPRADFFILITKLMAMGGKGLYQRTFDALQNMCGLRKPPTMSMATYQSQVSKTRNEISRLPAEFMIPPKLFQLCVVKGVEADPALSVTYGYLRRKLFDLDLDTVLSELTEAGGRPTIAGQGLAVNEAKVRDKVKKKKKQPCFVWRDTGTCRFCDNCHFSHDFSRVPSANSSGPPSTGKPGSCYECRGPHSIDNCPVFKARMDSMRQAEIQAMATRLSPTSSAAQMSAIRVASQAHALGLDPTLAAAIQAPSTHGASAVAGGD